MRQHHAVLPVSRSETPATTQISYLHTTAAIDTIRIAATCLAAEVADAGEAAATPGGGGGRMIGR